MKFNLMYTHLGYLNNKKPFINIVNDNEAEILIFYSNEPDNLYEKYKSDSLYISVCRFENNNAWVEIIKKIVLFTNSLFLMVWNLHNEDLF